MKEKIYTTDGAAALMAWRDEFVAKQAELEEALQKEEEAWKARSHQLKMQIKNMKRKADDLQALVSAEILAKIVENKQADQTYLTDGEFWSLTK